MNPTIPQLDREIFTVPRGLDFFTESELTAQTGYESARWWPEVIVKELVDNALDACEEAGVAPIIAVGVDKKHGIAVADNGTGIPAEVVGRIFDYQAKTSSKQAYVSPTRGAQGNALKTLLAIPFVLAGRKEPTTVEIAAQGARHIITLSNGSGLQPNVTHEQNEDSVKIAGTGVLVHPASSCSQVDAKARILPLLQQYALFNPHATFILNGHRIEPTNPTWQKWLPTDLPPAHWYTTEQLDYLIRLTIQNEEKAPTVRDFLAQNFRGLSSTVRRGEICEAAGVSGQRLHELNGNLKQLREAMIEATNPVKPAALGILGKQHLRDHMKPIGETFSYKRVMGTDDGGLPFVVEAGFAKVTKKNPVRGLHVGINWSVPLDQPFQVDNFDDELIVTGLTTLLSDHYVKFDDNDPVSLVLHVALPRFRFRDRGKGSVVSTPALIEAIKKTVLAVSREWARIKRREDRTNQREDKLRAKWERESRITVKDAAYDGMADAYNKVSSNGQLAAQARQIMYAARNEIQEQTGELLNDAYFTQQLPPDYMSDNPDETKDWDVVFDARGHLVEPHTANVIGIGTEQVRDYLAEADGAADLNLQKPNLIVPLIATKGYTHRYNALLYLEKEGFMPLLQQARIAEQYDLAIASSKGLNTVAVRTLIENLSRAGRKILVLHDFDKAGFSILGTLQRDNRRHKFATIPDVEDLGLRLADAKKLQSEEYNIRGGKLAIEANLIENGADEEEIEFMLAEATESGGYLHGVKRVELNAFTSAEFLKWLEGKLKKHKVEKVLPDNDTLAAAFRRIETARRYQQLIDSQSAAIRKQVEKLPVPANLQQRIKALLKQKKKRTLSWHQALAELTAPPALQKDQV